MFGLWLGLAWFTPALVASLLGWHATWGSGGVLVDFLTPLPVAGGVFHLPTLALVSFLLRTQPWRPALAGHARGVLFAGSALGLALLVDVNAVGLALSTDVGLQDGPWLANPLGLFLLCDTLLAQAFLVPCGGRGPRRPAEWGVAVAAIVVVVPAYLALAVQLDPRTEREFLYAGSRPGEQRGDERRYVYTRLAPTDAAFRAAAEGYVGDWDPRLSLDVEDVAVQFYASLAAAERRDDGAAVAALCLYEDGTAPRWVERGTTCFEEHESFADRLERHRAAVEPGLPGGVTDLVALWQACAQTPAIVMPLRAGQAIYDDNTRTVLCANLAPTRDALRGQFPDDAAARAALEALR